jgi:hypothetical protein
MARERKLRMTFQEQEDWYQKVKSLEPVDGGNSSHVSHEVYIVNGKKVTVYYYVGGHSPEWLFDWDRVTVDEVKDMQKVLEAAEVVTEQQIQKAPRVLTGAKLISDEREAQLEHYDADHDAHEVKGELAAAAALYAADDTYVDEILREKLSRADYTQLWPWHDGSYPDKRGILERIRQLTIAGALIAAEIDRLLASSDGQSKSDI